MANYFELNHLPQGQVEYDERLQFVPVSETTSYKGASIGDVSQKGLDNSTTPVAYEEVAPEWPQGPQKIAPKGYIWWIGTIGDFILSLTPVAFFGIVYIDSGADGLSADIKLHSYCCSRYSTGGSTDGTQ